MLPLVQPYNVSPFTYTGTEAVADASVFISNTITDWILVELRSTSTGAAVDRRAALLKNDGTVLEVDGTPGVAFSSVGAGDYFIVVKHRNHLAVMSAEKVTLPNTTAYDFTTGQVQAYGTIPMKPMSGVFGMYAGDANANGQVVYSGSASDKNAILSKVGLLTPANTVSGYYGTDLNMDGITSYSGTANDKNVLLGVVGLTTPANVISTQVP